MTQFERDVVERLARIETKLDNQGTKANDHETRIRSQERRSWVVIGLSLAISAVSPGLAKALGL